MDDLRWILLLVGVIVVISIYFSSRFEGEDWKQERKQFAKNKAGRRDRKVRKKQTLPKPISTVAPRVIKKEPTLDTAEPVIQKPAVSALVVEMSLQDEVETNEVEVKTVPVERAAPLEKETSRVETENNELSGETSEALPVEKFIEPGIEDEITEVEIPVDLAVAEAEIHVADATENEEPEQTKTPPDIEPLVLSVIVLAEDDETFSGPEIKEALEAEDLKHGAMSIFHFYDPDNKSPTENDDAVFSVANVLEPGFFDLDKLSEIQTPGLMLFCQLPGPLPGEAALEAMLDKGRGMAVRLHGHMCDDKRNRFTVQAKNHYLDRISAFSRELVLARSKTPVS